MAAKAPTTDVKPPIGVGRLFVKLAPVVRQKLLVIGIVMVGGFILMTIFAPWIAPYSPVESTGQWLQAPSAEHPLGTDQLRRDMLSRLIHGGRIPLIVAFASCFISLTIGMVVGLFAGYFGGVIDRVLSLIMDAIYSFPALILAIVIVAMLEPGLVSMIAAISFVYIPTYFRITRSQVLVVREMEYVDAARALGFKAWRVLVRHIGPNTLTSVLAVTSFNLADAILIEAGLSYLGFGLPPPAPDWGFDIQKGQQLYMAGYWWLITFPGIAIVLVCLGFGMVGEGVNDLLNPRRRKR